MQGAIYRGLFGLGSPLLFRCPSSSCRWNNTYVSLGFTSVCSDVTESTLRTVNRSLWENDESSGAHVLTPGGVNLSATYSRGNWQTVISVGSQALFTTQVYMEEWSYPTASPGPLGIARVGVLRARSTIGEAGVAKGLLLNETEILECDINLTASGLSDITVSANILSIGREELVPLRGGSRAEGDILVLLNQTGLPMLRASLTDLFAVVSFFESLQFVGNIYDGSRVPSPPQGVGFAFKSGNMSQVFHNMTKSMTDQLRSTFNASGRGLTISQVVHVHVRWEWLVLPLAVQALASLFLILVLARGRTDRVLQPWKSSSVAILGLQLTKGPQNKGEVLRCRFKSVTELKEMAKSNRAILE